LFWLHLIYFQLLYLLAFALFFVLVKLLYVLFLILLQILAWRNYFKACIMRFWPWITAFHFLGLFRRLFLILLCLKAMIGCKKANLLFLFRRSYIFVVSDTGLKLMNSADDVLFEPTDGFMLIVWINLEKNVGDIFVDIVGESLSPTWMLFHKISQIVYLILIEEYWLVEFFAVSYPLLSRFIHKKRRIIKIYLVSNKQKMRF